MGALLHTTPTAIAEEVYHASRAGRSFPTVKGPAGVVIPDPRSRYRPTVEGDLLRQIVRVSYAQFKAEQLMLAGADAVRTALLAALQRRFPQSDMAILRKYGAARPTMTINVEMWVFPFHRIELDAPVLVPNGAAHFRTKESGSGEQVAAEHLPFFHEVDDVRQAEGPQFTDALRWPQRINGACGRYPTWGEIGEQFERLGAWMQKERDAANGAA